ncbi:MAG: hypothetical protein GY841_04885, partial [FCB group bacterium]|nr:hypothetical protein [FCB group bacterium]
AAQSAQEIAAGILRDTPADLALKRPHVPYDLSRIVSRCLSKKPDKRFQTARDICNELEELSNDLKQEVAITVTEKGQTKQGSILSEESFILTTDLVRRLSHKDPKMIGRSLAFIDNGVTSDELIFILHGMGNDHRQFSDTLRQLPFRAIAFSLFGFDDNAKVRVPATLHDHSILMHALLKDIRDRLRPRQVILTGFSSGADRVLHFISSGEFVDIQLAGLLSLGCNIHLNDCFATSKLSLLTSGDENQILSTIKEFSNNSSSLSDWLLLHGYLLTAFSKFGIQTEPLRQYSNDIIAPFRDGDWTQFPKWYNSCVSKVPHVRFVFDSDGYNSLDKILKQHLEYNVLGDDFHEDTIVRDPSSHMELGQAEMVCKHILAFMKHIKAN